LKKFEEALQNYSPTERMAILRAVEEKRRKDNSIKYWVAQDQQALHFPLFTKDIKIFGILGGNRSGKTEEGVFIDVAWALGKKYFEGEPAFEYVKDLPIPEPPNNIWIVGLDYGVLKNVIFGEKLTMGRGGRPPLLPRDPQVVTKITGGDFQVYFENGSVITGKSADAGWEKFQAASVDLAHIDEECEVRVFNEIYQRTIDCSGKIILTLTPLVDVASGVKEPWVFDLFEEMRDGRKDVVFVKLNVLENPYVPEEEKKKLQEKWIGHYEERARIYGDFIQRSGLVYNLWDRKKHCVKRSKIPKDWRRIVSIDPAATGTTAAIWAAVEPGTNNLHLYQEYYESNRIVSDHAKNILVRNGGDAVDVWLLDPKWASQRNNETHKTGLQLYRENGIPVRAAEINYADYGLNAAREYFAATIDEAARHPKVFVFEDLENFIYEIEHYTWDFFQKGEQKGLSKDRPLKRNDHLQNAFQYLACMKPKARRSISMPRSDEEKRKYAELNSYS
jgi:phage terminase large subunit-like protein